MTAVHPPNSTAASTAPARDRPTFVLEFRAEPGIDAIKSLRALLKFAGRRLGLRAIDVRELEEEQQ